MGHNVCAQVDSNQPAHACSLIRLFTGRIVYIQEWNVVVFFCFLFFLFHADNEDMDAQADFSLHWAHMSESMFSHFAAWKVSDQILPITSIFIFTFRIKRHEKNVFPTGIESTVGYKWVMLCGSVPSVHIGLRTMVQIILCICAAWSGPSLSVYRINGSSLTMMLISYRYNSNIHKPF